MSERLENPELTSIYHRLGVDIGLDVICRVARLCPEDERRAMIWIANYALLQRSNPDQIADQLGLHRRDVRAALTNLSEDRTRFLAAVGKLRAEFEASFQPLVENSVTRQARKAVRFAGRHCSIVECVGPSRMGKTVVIKQEWHKLLDRAIYLHTPTGQGDADLQIEIGKALGILWCSGKKGVSVRTRIEACFAPDLISLIILDEAHRLWPRDPRQCTPRRIEYIRSLHRDGEGASVLVVATPQFSTGLLAAMDNNPRWSPDQWYGRRVPFFTPDTLSADELAAIARHHAPDFDAAMIDLLVEQALSCAGFAGLMVNSITLARDNAEVDGKNAVDYDTLADACAQMVRGTMIERMAEQAAAEALANPKPPRKPKRARTAFTPPPVPRLDGAALPPATVTHTGPGAIRIS